MNLASALDIFLTCLQEKIDNRQKTANVTIINNMQRLIAWS